MSTDYYIHTIFGFKIAGDQFLQTQPAKTEMKPQWDPDTGEKAPDKEVIIEEEEEFFVSPDGKKFTTFERMASHMAKKNRHLFIHENIEYDYSSNKEVCTLYIGPKVKGSNKSENMGSNITLYGQEQEITMPDIMVLDEIKKLLEDMGIKPGLAKIWTYCHVSC